ncbi:MAG: PIN domain-containing protein [Elusimicrobiota bacterium]
MKKLKVYIDTSVFGAFFDREDPKRVEVTLKFLETVKNEKIEGFISNITLEEIEKSPPEIRTELKRVIKDINITVIYETGECVELVTSYLDEKIIPEKYRDDARNIAVAVYNGLDAVISWNFRHMVNLIVKRKVNSVNLKLGYSPIEILSPEEVEINEEMGI